MRQQSQFFPEIDIEPCQWAGIYGQKRDGGYQRLAAAVLLGALQDAQGKRIGNEPERRRNEALKWFDADDHAPFAFVEICEALGIDPRRIRAQLSGQLRKFRRLPVA